MKYRNCIQIIWHSVWLGTLVNAFLTQNEVCRLVPQEINRCVTYGGRYIFMTHILQLASKLCYVGFLLSRFNIIKYESVSKFWSRLVLPLTSTVCLMYYILYTINPDLVRNPQAVQVINLGHTMAQFRKTWGLFQTDLLFQFIPAKLEFILHLAILPAAVLESIVGDHEIKVGETMKMMSLFMVSYSLWSLYCFFQSGLWPYRKFDLSIFISRVGGWLILSIGFMVPSWPGDPYCLSFDKS